MTNALSGAVFDEYHQQLAAFVFTITHSRELTEEIIRDVFLKIWEDRNTASGLKNFTAYLFIVTRNHTLNAIRKLTQVRKKQEAVSHHFMQAEEEEVLKPRIITPCWIMQWINSRNNKESLPAQTAGT